MPAADLLMIYVFSGQERRRPAQGLGPRQPILYWRLAEARRMPSLSPASCSPWHSDYARIWGIPEQ